jgi:hypothetical protein
MHTVKQNCNPPGHTHPHNLQIHTSNASLEIIKRSSNNKLAPYAIKLYNNTLIIFRRFITHSPVALHFAESQAAIARSALSRLRT